MDSCRLVFCLVNVIIRGQIEIASRCCVAVYYAYYGLRKDEVKRENNFQRKRRFFFRYLFSLRRISLYEEIRWKEIIVFLIYNFENKFIRGKILDIDIVYKLEKNIGVILG